MIIEQLVKAIGEEHVYGWYQPCQGDSLTVIVPHLGGGEAYIYAYRKPVEGNTALQFHSRPTCLPDNVREVEIVTTDCFGTKYPFGSLAGHGLKQSVLDFAKRVHLTQQIEHAYEGVKVIGVCSDAVIFEHTTEHGTEYHKADLADYDSKLAKALATMDKKQWTSWMQRCNLPHTIVRGTGLPDDNSRSKFAKKHIEAAYKMLQSRELEVARVAEQYIIRQSYIDCGMYTREYLDTALTLATQETCHSCVKMFFEVHVVLSVSHGLSTKLGGNGLKGIRK